MLGYALCAIVAIEMEDDMKSKPLKSKLLKSKLLLLLAAAALAASPVAAEAASRKKHMTKREIELRREFPSASNRQIRNALAYERGEYYEQMSEAHPVGSRAWWFLKERERGDYRR